MTHHEKVREFAKSQCNDVPVWKYMALHANDPKWSKEQPHGEDLDRLTDKYHEVTKKHPRNAPLMMAFFENIHPSCKQAEKQSTGDLQDNEASSSDEEDNSSDETTEEAAAASESDDADSDEEIRSYDPYFDLSDNEVGGKMRDFDDDNPFYNRRNKTGGFFSRSNTNEAKGITEIQLTILSLEARLKQAMSNAKFQAKPNDEIDRLIQQFESP